MNENLDNRPEALTTLTKQHRPSRIRFINTFEPVSRHYRDLFPYFIEHGWEIEVIISGTQYRDGRDETWISPGVHVRRMPNFGLKPQKRLFDKALLMLMFYFFVAFVTLFGPQVEKNVFLAQPPLISLWGIVLRKLRGQEFYYSVMDLYPDVAIALGYIRHDSLIAKFLTLLSRYSLREADALFVIGRCMKELIIALGLGIATDRIIVVPNWANHETIHPILHKHNPFRHEHHWEGKFVVVFAGNIGIPQFFDDILEVCRRFRGQSDFVFALVGNGLRRPEIEAYKREHNLENIVLLPFQPHSEQSYFLSAGDLHLVSLRAGIEGLSAPSKTYSILAAGRPIIYQGCENGEIARLVEEEDVGNFVPLHNPDTLEKVILEYKHNPDVANRQGTNARRLAESKLNYRAICRQYASTLGIISAA